ncbi:type II toxin-antitoxin system PemK/MazF family toxin [Levilactobacillus koreensis]|uniref:Type II toxin-antitoxin system PemK/MazF family toxin n=1 Tax=Levilactobacillus koreensis TaxID=637971 RepID=A0AAC8ZG62_9LACO|nr:type II toxin-antitoxin system PemK/MazF family toxin [Levilactobacillus koreensis]AKP64095.1 hypothetical protein ABN16_03160 [Levilactobacillus koreensis]
MNSKAAIKDYPEQQEIIWIDFQSSRSNELRDRHPAVVLSTVGFSKITNQVAVSLITHATSNRLKDMFVPVANNPQIEGYVNPLQFHTFSLKGRDITTTGTFLDDYAFAKVLRIHKQILNI